MGNRVIGKRPVRGFPIFGSTLMPISGEPPCGSGSHKVPDLYHTYKWLPYIYDPYDKIYRYGRQYHVLSHVDPYIEIKRYSDGKLFNIGKVKLDHPYISKATYDRRITMPDVSEPTAFLIKATAGSKGDYNPWRTMRWDRKTYCNLMTSYSKFPSYYMPAFKYIWVLNKGANGALNVFVKNQGDKISVTVRDRKGEPVESAKILIAIRPEIRLSEDKPYVDEKTISKPIILEIGRTDKIGRLNTSLPKNMRGKQLIVFASKKGYSDGYAVIKTHVVSSGRGDIKTRYRHINNREKIKLYMERYLSISKAVKPDLYLRYMLYLYYSISKVRYLPLPIAI